MHSYELTERGKIAIAVILVLLLLVVPSTILAVKAWSGTPPGDNQPQYTDSPPSISDDAPPAATSEPPPGDSVQNPVESTPSPEPTPSPSPEPTPGDNGENGTPDPTPKPPEPGPVGFDLAEGTLQFIFSPVSQKALDEDSLKLLGDFLTSPKNSANALIVVEIPKMPSDDTAVIKSAVISAFAKHGVSQKDLHFITSQSVTDEVAVEIVLSYITYSNSK